ncbi:MAG: DUF3761 domain-containing protein [Pseudomonadota bacterium]|nr:DUF3761 domain-containing protein [Pseudomonadota bacterium]
MTRAAVVQMMVTVASLMLAVSALGQVPAGSTGECKDGSFSSTPTKRGACAGHGGVKYWYDSKKTAAGTETKSSVTTATPNVDTTRNSASKSSSMPTTAAAGGGDGKVWVNTSSKVYHCSGDKWYGKTKKGEYMSEADAKAKGNHADHKKTCS